MKKIFCHFLSVFLIKIKLYPLSCLFNCPFVRLSWAAEFFGHNSLLSNYANVMIALEVENAQQMKKTQKGK